MHMVLMVGLASYKAHLSYLFGFTEQAEQLYRIVAKGGDYLLDTYHGIYLCLFASLTYYAHYRTSGRNRHLRLARCWHKKLLDMERLGCPNVTSFLALLHAEEQVSVRKEVNPADFVKLYGIAIAAMSNGNLVNYQALANELAGFALLDRDCPDAARGYFRVALYLYKEKWGATAKFHWLRERTIQLFDADCIPQAIDGSGDFYDPDDTTEDERGGESAIGESDDFHDHDSTTKEEWGGNFEEDLSQLSIR